MPELQTADDPIKARNERRQKLTDMQSRLGAVAPEAVEQSAPDIRAARLDGMQRRLDAATGKAPAAAPVEISPDDTFMGRKYRDYANNIPGGWDTMQRAAGVAANMGESEIRNFASRPYIFARALPELGANEGIPLGAPPMQESGLDWENRGHRDALYLAIRKRAEALKKQDEIKDEEDAAARAARTKRVANPGTDKTRPWNRGDVLYDPDENRYTLLADNGIVYIWEGDKSNEGASLLPGIRRLARTPLAGLSAKRDPATGQWVTMPGLLTQSQWDAAKKREDDQQEDFDILAKRAESRFARMKLAAVTQDANEGLLPISATASEPTDFVEVPERPPESSRYYTSPEAYWAATAGDPAQAYELETGERGRLRRLAPAEGITSMEAVTSRESRLYEQQYQQKQAALRAKIAREEAYLNSSTFNKMILAPAEDAANKFTRASFETTANVVEHVVQGLATRLQAVVDADGGLDERVQAFVTPGPRPEKATLQRFANFLRDLGNQVPTAKPPGIAAAELAQSKDTMGRLAFLSQPDAVVGDVAASLPYMAALMATGELSAPAGVFASVSIAQGRMEKTMVAQGVPVKDAQRLSFVGGGIEGAIEYLQAKQIISLRQGGRDWLRKRAMENMAKRVASGAVRPGAAWATAKVALEEALEEAAQAANEAGWMAWATGKPPKGGLPALIDKMLYEGTVAALTTGVMGGPSNVDTAVVEQSARDFVDNTREAILQLHENEKGFAKLPGEEGGGFEQFQDVSKEAARDLAERQKQTAKDRGRTRGQPEGNVGAGELQRAMEGALTGQEIRTDKEADRKAGRTPRAVEKLGTPQAEADVKPTVRETTGQAFSPEAKALAERLIIEQRAASKAFKAGEKESSRKLTPKEQAEAIKGAPATETTKATIANAVGKTSPDAVVTERDLIEATFKQLQKWAPSIYRQAGLDQVANAAELLGEIQQMDPADAKKLIHGLATARTDAEWRNVGERIEAVQQSAVLRKRQTTALNAYEKVVKNAKDIADKSPGDDGKYIRMLLNAYAEQGVSPEMLAKAERVIEDYETTDEDQRSALSTKRYDAAQKIVERSKLPPLKSMTPEAVDQITEYLQRQSEAVRLGRDVQRQARGEQRKQIVKRILDAADLTVDTRKTKAIHPGDKPVGMGKVRQALRYGRLAYTKMSTRMASLLNTNVPDPGQRGSPEYEGTVGRADRAERLGSKLYFEGMDVAHDAVKEIGFDPNSQEWMNYLNGVLDVYLPSSVFGQGADAGDFTTTKAVGDFALVEARAVAERDMANLGDAATFTIVGEGEGRTVDVKGANGAVQYTITPSTTEQGKWTLSKVSQAKKKPPKFIEVLAPSQDQPAQFTRRDLGMLYLRSKNPGTVNILAKAGIVRSNHKTAEPLKLSERDIMAISRATPPEIKHVVDRLAEYLPIMAARINVAREAAGLPPIRVEDFYDLPRNREGKYHGDHVVSTTDIMDWQVGLESDMDFTRKRTKGQKHPVVLEPFDETFDRYNWQSAQYVAKLPVLHDLNAIFTDTELANALTTKFGDLDGKTWQRWLENQYIGRPPAGPISQFGRGVVRRMQKALLAGRVLTTMPRQFGNTPTSAHIIAGGRRLGYEAFTKTAGAMFDSNNHVELTKYSPGYRLRMHQTPTEYLTPGSGTDTGKHAFTSPIKSMYGPQRKGSDKFLATVYVPDQRQLWHTWAASKYVADHDYPGLRFNNPEAYWAKVDDIFTTTFQRSAPFSSPADAPPVAVEAAGSSTKRVMLTQFKSYFTQVHNLIGQEVGRFNRSDHTAADYRRAASAATSVLSSVAYSTGVSLAARSLWLALIPRPEKEEEPLYSRNVGDAVRNVLLHLHPMADIIADVIDMKMGRNMFDDPRGIPTTAPQMLLRDVYGILQVFLNPPSDTPGSEFSAKRKNATEKWMYGIEKLLSLGADVAGWPEAAVTYGANLTEAWYNRLPNQETRRMLTDLRTEKRRIQKRVSEVKGAAMTDATARLIEQKSDIDSMVRSVQRRIKDIKDAEKAGESEQYVGELEKMLAKEVRRQYKAMKAAQESE